MRWRRRREERHIWINSITNLEIQIGLFKSNGVEWSKGVGVFCPNFPQHFRQTHPPTLTPWHWQHRLIWDWKLILTRCGDRWCSLISHSHFSHSHFSHSLFSHSLLSLMTLLHDPRNLVSPTPPLSPLHLCRLWKRHALVSVLWLFYMSVQLSILFSPTQEAPFCRMIPFTWSKKFMMLMVGLCWICTKGTAFAAIKWTICAAIKVINWMNLLWTDSSWAMHGSNNARWTTIQLFSFGEKPVAPLLCSLNVLVASMGIPFRSMETSRCLLKLLLSPSQPSHN